MTHFWNCSLLCLGRTGDDFSKYYHTFIMLSHWISKRYFTFALSKAAGRESLGEINAHDNQLMHLHCWAVGFSCEDYVSMKKSLRWDIDIKQKGPWHNWRLGFLFRHIKRACSLIFGIKYIWMCWEPKQCIFHTTPFMLCTHLHKFHTLSTSALKIKFIQLYMQITSFS